MRPVSDAFLESLRGSHSRFYEAFVVAPGQTGVEPTGTQLSLIDGDVKLDADAAIRSIVDLAVEGYGWFPDNAEDLLAPYGNEIFIRVGMVFGGGAVEYVSLGYFRILDTNQEDAPDGPIQINAQDRMAGILEARLLNPVQFSSTDTYGDVVEQLIQEVFSWATIEWDDLTYLDPLGRSVVAEEDRFAFLNELVTSLGKIWYWDHRGVLVICNAPPQDEPVWSVDRARKGHMGAQINVARELSRDGVYNAVKASGEALDDVTPVYAVAYDNNPVSPTFYDGDFGKVPMFYVSPFITTVGQAQSAAEALLIKKLGLPYQVEFTAISNPALEPYDAVLVEMRQGVSSIHVIDTLNIPLTYARPMTCTTREQTLIVIGEL
jgi:hypothetical protein